MVYILVSDAIDENIIKYDYNLEPEEPVDCMSEEERMNEERKKALVEFEKKDNILNDRAEKA